MQNPLTFLHIELITNIIVLLCVTLIINFDFELFFEERKSLYFQ
jgi:hypothetical protein